jgi:transposase-like protein
MKHRKMSVYDKGFKLNAVKLYLENGRTDEQVGKE